MLSYFSRRKSKHRKPWMNEQGSSLLQKQHGKSAESSLFIEADPRNYPGTIHMPCSGGSMGSSLGGAGEIDHRRLIQLMPLKHSSTSVPIYDTHPNHQLEQQSECLYYTHPISQPMAIPQPQPQQQGGIHECDSGVDGCSLVDCTCPAASGTADVMALSRMGLLSKDHCGTIPEVTDRMTTRLGGSDRQPDITDTSQR